MKPVRDENPTLDSPTWPDKVRAVYRHHGRELRFAAFKFRAMGFRISRVTLDRLAYRLAFNGVDWKRAATREAVYQTHLALDPDYSDGSRSFPFAIGM